MMLLPIPDDLRADLAQVESVVVARMQERPVVIQAARSAMEPDDLPPARAMLTLLAARLGRYDFQRVLHTAVAAELIHAATVVHDGLVDEAMRRRAQPASSQRWSGDVALMVGDLLLALAAAEMALAPDARIIGLYSRAVMAFCEGKLAPVSHVAPFEQALAEYEYAAECRTAALFSAAARVGAICGGGDDALGDQMARFGMELGMALHIAADIRDFTAVDGSAGRGLRAGRITLPLIYAVEAGGAELAALVDQQPFDARRSAAALDQIVLLGVPPARAAAQERAQRAMDLLTALPAQAARDALIALTGWAIAE